MKNIFYHIRLYLMRGFLAVIPMALCVIVVDLLYQLIDHRVMVFLQRFFDVRGIPGFGILLLLVLLFLIGAAASNVVGREALRLIEYASTHIPVVKQVYALSKQVGDVFLNASDHSVFRKAVLVNLPNAGQRTIAFVTGRVKDQNTGEDWLKVYVPMAHPIVGFMFLVRETEAADSGLSVEDAFKMVVSLGIITPRKP
ncbi:MAG: DUF502 domain-containing protein [Candidatus Omnitrophica bacterium]|nr:DUF502 domain-containing protein [Candidatus Omnitrophota bacterium]